MFEECLVGHFINWKHEIVSYILQFVVSTTPGAIDQQKKERNILVSLQIAFTVGAVFQEKPQDHCAQTQQQVANDIHQFPRAIDS